MVKTLQKKQPVITRSTSLAWLCLNISILGLWPLVSDQHIMYFDDEGLEYGIFLMLCCQCQTDTGTADNQLTQTQSRRESPNLDQLQSGVRGAPPLLTIKEGRF